MELEPESVAAPTGIDGPERSSIPYSQSSFGTGSLGAASYLDDRSRAGTDPSSENFPFRKPLESQTSTQAQDMRPSRKRNIRRTSDIHNSINYKGTTLNMAASDGNLPVFVLIWGMAKAKRINLMVPDQTGNNPFHYAALAESTEVRPSVISVIGLTLPCRS
jgi:ankyrin repeat protein